MVVYQEMRREGGWVRVVFHAECDEDDNCPVCNEDYSDCPGPTQDDMCIYKEKHGMLYAKKKAVGDS